MQSARLPKYPIGIVPAEDDEEELDGAISDELIEDPSISCSKRLGGIFAVIISAPLPIKFYLRTNKLYPYPSEFALTASVFSNRAPMQRLL